MTFKNLLLGLCADAEIDQAALCHAVGLANVYDAHLSIAVASLELQVPGSLLSNLGASLAHEENRTRRAVAAEVRDRSVAHADLRGVRCSVDVHHGDLHALAHAVRRAARAHDLVVLGPGSDAISIERSLAQEVLFASGRPAIIVPPQREEFHLRHIVVGWDGSAQAARALNDAMPLLRSAPSVDLVVVSEAKKSRDIMGADIALHLSRHGVDAELIELKSGKRETADRLREHVSSKRTDLVVLGAFAHSWWRELVLGGVTQSFLGAPPVPIFMSR